MDSSDPFEMFHSRFSNLALSVGKSTRSGGDPFEVKDSREKKKLALRKLRQLKKGSTVVPTLSATSSVMSKIEQDESRARDLSNFAHQL